MSHNREKKSGMFPAKESSPVKLTEPNAASGEDPGLRGALARGIAAKRNWVDTGEVVLPVVLAERWGCEPEYLAIAVERRDLFTVGVEGLRYVPAEFLDLDALVVAAVCRGLGPLADAEKLVFWKRRHGALGGKPVAAVLKTEGDAGLERVLQLARGHKCERTSHGGSAKGAQKSGGEATK